MNDTPEYDYEVDGGWFRIFFRFVLGFLDEGKTILSISSHFERVEHQMLLVGEKTVSAEKLKHSHLIDPQ